MCAREKPRNNSFNIKTLLIIPDYLFMINGCNLRYSSNISKQVIIKTILGS